MSEEVHGTPLERLRREVGELRSKLLEIDRIVGDLEEPGDTEDRGGPASIPMDLRSAAQAVRSLSQGGDQADILTRLLEEAARYTDRAALFLEQEQENGYRAWRAQGFSSQGWETVEIPADDPLVDTLRGQRILEFDLAAGAAPSWMLSMNGRGRAAMFPLSFGDRTPLLLYADGLPEPQMDSLEMLVEMARLVLQNQYLGLLVQVQDQGGPVPARWPALENMASARTSRDAPAAVEEPHTAMEADSAPTGLEPPPPEAYQEQVNRQSAAGSKSSGIIETLDEDQPSTGEPVEAAQQRAPTGEPPDELASETPAGDESTWEIESKADLRPEDLGLSQEEFDRLMGQASTDWLEIQKAREAATTATAGEETQEIEPTSEQGTQPQPAPIRGADTPAPKGPQESYPAEEPPHRPEPTEERSAPEAAPRQPDASAWGGSSRPEQVSVPPLPSEEGPEVDVEPTRAAAATTPGTERDTAAATAESIAQRGPSEEKEPEVVQEVDPATATAETLHEEARRFARLLVAEIKLYNESEVETGRQNKDLYSRLKSDIDRSREMYEKRVHPSVKSSADYFHAQLLQVLAQDDAALMGQDYPGSQVVENA